MDILRKDSDTKLGTALAPFAEIHGVIIKQNGVAVAPIESPVFTGNPRGVTAASGNHSVTLATTAFVQGEIGNLGDLTLLDEVGTGNITNGAVTNAKLANMAGGRFKGRKTSSGTGAPEDLTDAEVLAELNLAAIATSGSASDLGTGTIPAARIGADTIDAITEIASGIKTGADAKLVTGTAGTSGNFVSWDANGDAVDSGSAASSFSVVGHDHSGVYQPENAKLTSLAGLSYSGNTLKVIRVNAGETGFELVTISAGGGDALISGTLDQFADVTQDAGKTLAITGNTTLAGGTHSGTNTGDQDLSGLAVKANNLSDLTNAATAATNLGLGTGNSPQFTAINLGHASDTTITRVSAGVLAVEGVTIYAQGGALGTPASGNLTNCIGLPASTGITGLATIATSGSASDLGAGTIPAARIGADTIDAITEIATGIKTGADAKLVTGTAGTSGNFVSWDANGDAVDSGSAAASFQPADTQLTSLASLSYTGNMLKVVRVNATETAFELAMVSLGGGDAQTSNNLDQFADVTQTSGRTLAITGNTTLAGGTHSGTNTGDQDLSGLMVKANNLSDVANAATAFDNIKQAATDTTTGVVELATDGETSAGLVVQGNDSRLSDARNPTAHAASHTDGTDDIALATSTQKGLMSSAYAAQLDGITGTNTGDQDLSGLMVKANNLSDVANAATAATNLGLGTGNSPQFTAINVGHATDTTLTRVSAGVIAVEGATIYAQGGALGTPASGNLTNCIGLPVSGIAASTSTALGVGSVELGHASDTTLTRVSAGVIAVEGVTIYAQGGALGTPASGNLTNCSGLSLANTVGTLPTAKIPPYWIEIPLTAPGVAVATGTKVAMVTHMANGTITGFKAVCDPANEPSAAAIQVDMNAVNLANGTATSRLSAVASISTGANLGNGTISGTQTVTVGDQSSFDIDQGSDGKELRALFEFTPA